MSTKSKQFQLGLNWRETKSQLELKSVYVYSKLSPIEPTVVFDTFWKFAAERQNIFFRKYNGEYPPWTNDSILSKHKFTNVYRASDRVSQYLIKNVIYSGEQTPNELFFRILFFKVFNKIETWKNIKDYFGEIAYSSYSFDKYDKVLTEAINKGSIFSAAYIMPSGKKAFGYSKKHRNLLKLIELMIEDNIPLRLTECKSMKEGFEILRSYPMLGDFLAYQYIIDINYSKLTNFSESEFVVPGPGAKNGIRKTFKNYGGLSEVDLIKLMVDRQEEEFARLRIDFKPLWGRPIQLIDCQNLFCEVDKYSRVAHPNIQGINNRKRIKQLYKITDKRIDYWYPPKWGINNHLENI